MPSTHGHGQYDAGLLAEAPEATKQMRQEGYNPDLLHTPKKQNTDLEQGLGARTHAASKEQIRDTDQTPRGGRFTPWYRTTRGKVIIAVVVLVIFGAVVGGAVGGTQSKKNKGDTVSAPGGQTLTAPGGEIVPVLTTASGNVGLSAISQALPATLTKPEQPVQTANGRAGQGVQPGRNGQQVGPGGQIVGQVDSGLLNSNSNSIAKAAQDLSRSL